MFVRWAEDYLFEKHVEALKASVPRLAVLEPKGVGRVGLEPTTLRLKAGCSTD